MKRGTSTAVVAELRRIASEAEGVLKPEDVVEAAKAEASPLHSMFCWDDAEAAEKYRLTQARELIRTTVEMLPVNGAETAVRVFVSLTPDRKEDGGGYRETIAVLGDRSMKKQLLVDAVEELKAFEDKYANLKELAEVFTASRRVRWQVATHQKAA